MTRSDARPRAIDFALFATGAPFSRHVLRALRERGCRPRRIVVPGYPPATPAAPRIETTTPAAADEFTALAAGIEFDYAPPALEAACAARLETAAIDFILVACWPCLLAPQTLAAARKAALNLHPSLLPRFRGADPLALQLAAGDPNFGVTLHLLDAHYDHGDIVAQAEIEISPGNAGREALERACAESGADLFVDAAASYDQGWNPRAQTA